MASTPASARYLARTRSASRVPMAAPHSKRPCLSREGTPLGGLFNLSFMVARVNKPIKYRFASTMGSFPLLLSRRICSFSCALFSVEPSTRSSTEVMTSESKVLRSRTSSASRVVTKPSRALPQVPLSLMQTELKPRAARNSSKSRSVALGRRTAGFATYPGLCDLTIFACSS